MNRDNLKRHIIEQLQLEGIPSSESAQLEYALYWIEELHSDNRWLRRSAVNGFIGDYVKRKSA